MKRTILELLLAAIPHILLAQHAITGYVNDPGGQPLPGAIIRAPASMYATATDANGHFAIKHLPAGPLTLVCTFLGYTNDTILANAETNPEIQFKLSPSVLMQSAVIVKSTRADNLTPVANQTINHDQLNQSNFGSDMPMLLGKSISAVATSDAGNGMGYSELRIRGTDMTRINITINGIPLNDPESQNVFWVDLPDFAASTDNVQIQRGVGTSANGAASFGASINLQSAEPKTDAYAEYNTAAGSFNTFRNSLSFGTGLFHQHFAFDARVSKMSSDGYIDRSASSLFSYYLSGSYSAPHQLLRMLVFSGTEKTGLAWDGVPADMLSSNRHYNPLGIYYSPQGIEKYYSNETDNYKQTHFQLLYSTELYRNLTLNLSIHHTLGAGYYEQYKEDRYLPDYQLQPIFTGSDFVVVGEDTIATDNQYVTVSDLVRQKHLKNSFTGFTWSVSYRKGKLNTDIGAGWNYYKGNNFGRVVWAEWMPTLPSGFEYYRNNADKSSLNLYAKANYYVLPKVNLWLDLLLRSVDYRINGLDDDKRDITTRQQYPFFDPKAGITFALDNRNEFYFSFAQASREPNRDNFTDARPGGPKPKPEHLYDFEAGYHFANPKWNFGSNIYLMYYKDQLVLTGAINDVGAAVMQNVPVSYRAGIELSSSWQIAHWVVWETNATFSQNQIKSFTEFIVNYDDETANFFVPHKNTNLAFSPSVLANSTLKFAPLNNLGIEFSAQYVGRQYIDNTYSTDRALDAYLVTNLLVQYGFNPKWAREMGVSLQVNNLFNELYESKAWAYRYYYDSQLMQDVAYYPQAGIHFMAGLHLKF